MHLHSGYEAGRSIETWAAVTHPMRWCIWSCSCKSVAINVDIGSCNCLRRSYAIDFHAVINDLKRPIHLLLRRLNGIITFRNKFISNGLLPMTVIVIDLSIFVHRFLPYVRIHVYNRVYTNPVYRSAVVCFFRARACFAAFQHIDFFCSLRKPPIKSHRAQTHTHTHAFFENTGQCNQFSSNKPLGSLAFSSCFLRLSDQSTRNGIQSTLGERMSKSICHIGFELAPYTSVVVFLLYQTPFRAHSTHELNQLQRCGRKCRK